MYPREQSRVFSYRLYKFMIIESFLRDMTWFFNTFGDQMVISTLLFFQAYGICASAVDKSIIEQSPGLYLVICFLATMLCVGMTPLVYMWLFDHIPLVPPQHFSFFQSSMVLYLLNFVRLLLKPLPVDNSAVK